MASGPTKYAVEHAKWEVIWAVVKKGEKRLVVVDFDTDFVAARDLYVKAKAAGKKLVTLRSRNLGFPPPEKIADKILAYNKQGVWWCPFCMRLARFEKRGWSDVDDQVYSADPAYYCPVCDISHKNGTVMRHNPIAVMLQNKRRTRSGRKTKSGKRGKRRR